MGQKHSKMAILAKNGQILTIFGHFEGQKIFDRKNFWWSSMSYGDTTLRKKAKKKYRTVKAVGPERTNGCTDVRTNVRE